MNNAAARTLSAAVIAVGMIASACSTSEGQIDDALPPAPDVRDVRAAAPMLPDDGLLRVTVTIPGATEVQTDRPQPEALARIAGVLEANDDTDSLSFEDLADIPPDSTLTMRDDVLGYLRPDGEFVPLSRGGDGEPATLDLRLVGEAERAGYLSALPGVVTVRSITPSTFAVAATSTEAMESLGLEIAEDTFLTFSADPYEGYQWALENDGSSLSNVGLPQAPSQSPDADIDGVEAREASTGRGVVVAVIDAGVDFSHPDLSHAQWLNPGEDCTGVPNGLDDDGNGFIDDCGGWDFGDEDATPFDGNNDEHGTHVAGIIAAKQDNGVGIAGLAPDAEIMDLKVNDESGMISMSSIARAVRYATDNGADVVNLSLGTLPGASLESVAVLEDAVNYADSMGVLLVAAAGNSGISLDNSAVYPASFDTPNLLVVGASTSADQRASFSNTGSDVDLFAPGDLILSTIPGGEVVFMSGTSQAAPIAAATAALFLERNSGDDPATVIGQLVALGDRLDSLDGLAANPVRLNSARAMGIEVDLLGVDDGVTIRGLAADDAGRVSASVSIPELGGQFNQPFHWEASLLTLIDGDPFAVLDHPVTVRDVEGDELRSVQTDRRGAVRLAEKGVRLAELSTVLPTGSYALLVEAVPRTDATARLGDGFLARFDVGDPGDQTGEGGGSDPSPGTSDGSSADDGGDPGSSTVESGPAIDPGGPNQTGTTDSGSSDGSPVDGGAEQGGGGAVNSDAADAETSDGGVVGDEGTTDDEGSNEVDQAGDDSSPTGGGDSESSDDSGGATEPDNTSESSGSGESVDGEGDVVELGPEEGSADGWSITSITPRTGPVDSKNLVVLDGSFPEPVVVWFGDEPGETIFWAENSLHVETPIHAVAETVDVNLRTSGGEVLRLPDAYAFVPIGTDPAVQETPPTSDSGTEGSGEADTAAGDGANETGGDQPTFDDDPVDQVAAGDPPAANVSDPDGPSNKSRNRQARADVIGEPRLLPNGLTGAPMSGLETVGGVPACDEAICRTRRV